MNLKNQAIASVVVFPEKPMHGVCLIRIKEQIRKRYDLTTIVDSLMQVYFA